MRSAISRRLASAACGLLLTAGPLGAAVTGDPPSRQEVQTVLQAIKADPELGGTHMEKRLRFKKTDEKKPEQPNSDPLRWLRELFEWIGSTARLLVWLLAFVAVALLLVGLQRWMRVRGQALDRPRPALPSHVRNLDIRPESLPDAIGTAAAALWNEGAHLPALSMLYRGALSRLVHVHGVPIRGASTEDECAALARRQLKTAPGEFVTALVAAWQLAVYGARLPETDSVMRLCSDFDLHLAPEPSIRAYKVAP